MNALDELRKAIEEAAGAAPDLLRKSQMGFDFGTPATATPNPHHVAYTRRNQSGKVSQIQAKGAQTHPEMVKELHGAYERHDSRGRGGMGISTEHRDYSTPDRYLQTAKNILKHGGHERLGTAGSDEVKGMLNRHIQALEAAKPDHGHMRFNHKDGLGSINRLHATRDRIWAGGGPEQRTPMALSNYMYMHREGNAANTQKMQDAVRDAYNNSGGDPQKVLQAIKTVTNDSRWELHSHDKPVD